MKRFFTSESVTEGHPDKVCDRIADSILDELLKQDAYARSAVECCAAYDTLFLTGEVTANAAVRVRSVQDYRKNSRTVAGYRARRGRFRRIPRKRRGRLRRGGGGRSGHDVRLRLPRNRRADAHARRIGA